MGVPAGTGIWVGSIIYLAIALILGPIIGSYVQKRTKDVDVLASVFNAFYDVGELDMLFYASELSFDETNYQHAQMECDQFYRDHGMIQDQRGWVLTVTSLIL